jgi:hypothetical protein
VERSGSQATLKGSITKHQLKLQAQSQPQLHLRRDRIVIKRYDLSYPRAFSRDNNAPMWASSTPYAHLVFRTRACHATTTVFLVSHLQSYTSRRPFSTHQVKLTAPSARLLDSFSISSSSFSTLRGRYGWGGLDGKLHTQFPVPPSRPDRTVAAALLTRCRSLSLVEDERLAAASNGPTAMV